MEQKNLNEEALQEENRTEETAQEDVQTETADCEVIDETEQKIAQLEQQAADHLDKYQRCLPLVENLIISVKEPQKKKQVCMTMVSEIPWKSCCLW